MMEEAALLSQISLPEGAVETSAVAVLGVAFILVLRWMISHLSTSLREVERAIHVNTLTLLSVQSQLLTHDLTVTGLNPSTGATSEIRDSKALAKYTELQKTIEIIHKAVEELVKRNNNA